MIDWSLVKKTTLWEYEELIEKLSEVFSYGFIRECYDHRMDEAADYIKKLLGYDSKHEEYVSKMTSTFRRLNNLGVKSYTDLIRSVESREKCRDFLDKTDLSFEDLISSVNCIFRWILPHCLYLRELTDTANLSHKNYVEELRKREVRFNLDILEQCRFRKGRETLAEKANIPKSFVSHLVNLADMSRLPYSNRKTVIHLSAAGYDSLAKLAETDSDEFTEDMRSYFERKGVKLSGFIDLKGISQWAKTVPIVIENS